MSDVDAPPSAPKILLVEDDKFMRALLALRLEFLGAHIELVPDANAALAVLETYQPDLILSDGVMPGMDGFTLCQRVKANPKLNGVPFLLFTSLTRDLRDRCLAAGVDDFLSKQEQELVFRLRTRLLLELGLHRAAAPSTQAAPRGSVVAVLSKSAPIQAHIQVQLSKEDLEVRAYLNPEGVFLGLQHKAPNLLVVDLEQEASGYQDWLVRLKGLPGCAEIPILALMGKGEEDRYQELEDLLDDRMLKPLEAQETRHRLRLLLWLAHARTTSKDGAGAR